MHCETGFSYGDLLLDSTYISDEAEVAEIMELIQGTYIRDLSKNNFLVWGDDRNEILMTIEGLETSPNAYYNFYFDVGETGYILIEGNYYKRLDCSAKELYQSLLPIVEQYR